MLAPAGPSVTIRRYVDLRSGPVWWCVRAPVLVIPVVALRLEGTTLAARAHEEQHTGSEHDAQESIELTAAREDEAEGCQHETDRVDRQHGPPMGEAEVEQAVVEMPAVGGEGSLAGDQARRTMIQNVSMMGTPSTSMATATLAVPRMESTASA